MHRTANSPRTKRANSRPGQNREHHLYGEGHPTARQDHLVQERGTT